MKEFIEKLIGRLEEYKYSHLVEHDKERLEHCTENERAEHCEGIDCFWCVWNKSIEIVNQLAEEYKSNLSETLTSSDGWIPVSERLPQVETEVLICARRKYTGGHFKDIITTAMYEDGTVLENDSCWYWEDIDGEWDEENDCYIIPEGWWENRHYNPDEVYNNAVDNKVIAWQPLPAPYQPEEGRE